MKREKVTAPRRGGRPSEIEAVLIRDHILDIATELFLTHGYGATSIEAIAKQAAISKRTFYHRFEDKADIFAAVVKRLIGKMRPADMTPLFAGGTLEEILKRLAKIILDAALSENALALHRLMISETQRFPELTIIMQSEGTRNEAITRIADLLTQFENPGGRENALFAAEQFLQMVVTVPQNRALGLGAPMTIAELDVWANNTVELFLHGYLKAHQR